MKQIKVLHVLTSDRYSGAENVACQIIHGFEQEPSYQLVYCSPDGPIRKALEEQQVPFAAMQKWSLPELKRVIREQKPDIIHAHDMKASLFSALVCGSIPMVSHIHNNSYDSQKVTVKAVLYRYAARKAKHIFWVSHAAMEGYCYAAQFAPKSSVLYNVIDAEQLRGKASHAENKDVYDIVYLGRMTYPKNPQRLVGVLEQLVKQCPEVRVAMIGAGELEKETTELIRAKHLEQQVKMLGFMSNPYAILEHAKAMVMTSRWEGLPMCSLEAMALGVPIVSTPTDGLKELIREGENGFLSDDDAVLAQKLAEMVQNSSLQTKMSENCRMYAEKTLNIRAYVRTIRAEYEACLKR